MHTKTPNKNKTNKQFLILFNLVFYIVMAVSLPSWLNCSTDDYILGRIMSCEVIQAIVVFTLFIFIFLTFLYLFSPSWSNQKQTKLAKFWLSSAFLSLRLIYIYKHEENNSERMKKTGEVLAGKVKPRKCNSSGWYGTPDKAAFLQSSFSNTSLGLSHRAQDKGLFKHEVFAGTASII